MSNRNSSTMFASEAIVMVSDFIQTIDAVKDLADLTRPGKPWYEDMAPQMIDNIVGGLMGALTTVTDTIDAVGEGFFSDEEIELMARAEEIAIDLAVHRGAKGIDMTTGEELSGDALKAKLMEFRSIKPGALGRFHDGGRIREGDPIGIPDGVRKEIEQKLNDPNLDESAKIRLRALLDRKTV